MDTQSFIVILLSSGVMSAIVASLLQRNYEREKRKFQAKFRAYVDFTKKLLGLYDISPDNLPDIIKLDELSSEVMLVAPNTISDDVSKFNRVLDETAKAVIEFNKMKSGAKKDRKSHEIMNLSKKIVRFRARLLRNMREDIQEFIS